MTGLSGVPPSDWASILHGHSWLHPRNHFDKFLGLVSGKIFLLGESLASCGFHLVHCSGSLFGKFFPKQRLC